MEELELQIKNTIEKEQQAKRFLDDGRKQFAYTLSSRRTDLELLERQQSSLSKQRDDVKQELETFLNTYPDVTIKNQLRNNQRLQNELTKYENLPVYRVENHGLREIDKFGKIDRDLVTILDASNVDEIMTKDRALVEYLANVQSIVKVKDIYRIQPMKPALDLETEPEIELVSLVNLRELISLFNRDKSVAHILSAIDHREILWLRHQAKEKQGKNLLLAEFRDQTGRLYLRFKVIRLASRRSPTGKREVAINFTTSNQVDYLYFSKLRHDTIERTGQVSFTIYNPDKPDPIKKDLSYVHDASQKSFPGQEYVIQFGDEARLYVTVLGEKLAQLMLMAVTV